LDVPLFQLSQSERRHRQCDHHRFTRALLLVERTRPPRHLSAAPHLFDYALQDVRHAAAGRRRRKERLSDGRHANDPLGVGIKTHIFCASRADWDHDMADVRYCDDRS
jgi:hypothetical protein